MIPVEQTRPRNGTERGDCLRACIASLLEVDLTDVPDLMNDQATHPNDPDWQWHTRLDPWLRQHGYRETFTIPPGEPYIVWGPCGDGSDTLHALVAQNGRIIHDPHPDRPGIAGPPTGWLAVAPL